MALGYIHAAMPINIRHGRSVDDGRVNLERLSSCIRRIDADVLALQEVDCVSSPVDLTAIAAAAIGAKAHRFAAAIAGTPGATWMAATGSDQPGNAAHGIALLSRYPAISWQVLGCPACHTSTRSRARRWSPNWTPSAG